MLNAGGLKHGLSLQGNIKSRVFLSLLPNLTLPFSTSSLGCFPCPHGPKWLLEPGHYAKIPAIREEAGNWKGCSLLEEPWHLEVALIILSRHLVQNSVTWPPQLQEGWEVQSLFQGARAGIQVSKGRREARYWDITSAQSTQGHAGVWRAVGSRDAGL